MVAERRHPLVWVIEAFSVATGAAFIISGVGNALTFWLAWKINYFMVATPGDIIMSGFIILTVLAFWIVIGLAAAAIFFFGLATLRSVKVTQLRISLKGVAAGITIAASLLSIISAIAGLWGAQRGTADRMARDVEVFTEWAKEPPVFSYATGLRLAPGSVVQSDCENALVLWMGSSAVILRCREGVRIHHKLDGLVTQPLS